MTFNREKIVKSDMQNDMEMNVYYFFLKYKITNLTSKRSKQRTIKDVKKELNRLMDIPIDYEKLLIELWINREKIMQIDPASKRIYHDM